MARSRRRIAWIALAMAGVLAFICAGPYWPFIGAHLTSRPTTMPAGAPSWRSHPWATRVAAPPLENFHRVSADLYRGAQPDAKGMKRLEAMGIKTVVNLRLAHSDRGELRGTCLGYVHIGIDPLKPEEDEVVEFLRVVTDPNRTPVFVHCNRGIDRTGMVCAVYRMAVQGWSRDEAAREMTEGSFGYDHIFKNLVHYLWRLDVEELRRKAGVRTKPAPSRRSASSRGAARAP